MTWAATNTQQLTRNGAYKWRTLRRWICRLHTKFQKYGMWMLILIN